jgi:hypothetical protein
VYPVSFHSWSRWAGVAGAVAVAAFGCAAQTSLLGQGLAAVRIPAAGRFHVRDINVGGSPGQVAVDPKARTAWVAAGPWSGSGRPRSESWPRSMSGRTSTWSPSTLNGTRSGQRAATGCAHSRRYRGHPGEMGSADAACWQAGRCSDGGAFWGADGCWRVPVSVRESCRELAFGLLGAPVACSRSGWLGMVRRRSTVRFRKGAPGQSVIPGLSKAQWGHWWGLSESRSPVPIGDEGLSSESTSTAWRPAASLPLRICRPSTRPAPSRPPTAPPNADPSDPDPGSGGTRPHPRRKPGLSAALVVYPTTRRGSMRF